MTVFITQELVLCSQPVEPSTQENSAANYNPSDTATCQRGIVQGRGITEGFFNNTIQAVENSFALTIKSENYY